MLWISIQSLLRTRSFAEIITPAVKPSSASLKTIRRIAISAPSPDRKYAGDLSERIESTQTAAPSATKIFSAWKKPLIGTSLNRLSFIPTIISAPSAAKTVPATATAK